MGFVIAIDGPAASGKGTLARRLAQAYGLRHLDTGLTYRAVANAMLKAGKALEDEQAAVEIASELNMADLDRNVLASHGIGEAASRIAVFAPVRAALVEAQRRFAASADGAVLDGRDIGTVVCPGADIKFYVTASPEIRAGRRLAEIADRGESAEFDRILEDIRKRDARDTERADSPLRPAADAHLIDTTSMDIETAFRTAAALVESRMAEMNRER